MDEQFGNISFLNEISKQIYFVCLEYSGGGQTFTEDNSQGGLTRITADRNIFERQFWEMFLQPPLADLTLTFEDGDLTVNRAVLAALSGEEIFTSHRKIFFENRIIFRVCL